MTTTATPAPMTGEQAAAYQRLRAHLAYLKLPTAAEQLPEILDTARAEKLSVTATLERLLAAEVTATEQRRLPGPLRPGRPRPTGGSAVTTTATPAPMTGEQAAAYQRLRAHLAYLKLPTAAEQLPEILDTARAEKLSVTATLERLLAAEVTATEQRRLPGRLRFASLPAPWTLEDLDFDASPAVDRTLINDLATLRFIEQARNVLLVGPPGRRPGLTSDSARTCGTRRARPDCSTRAARSRPSPRSSGCSRPCSATRSCWSSAGWAA